jgi:DNA polymerase III alpha subunit
MKTAFVTDLSTEQSITSFFLVHEKEIRNTRAGKAFLRLELGDRSGAIEAVMWDQFEAAAKDISRDDIVKVQARVEITVISPSSLFRISAAPNRKRWISPIFSRKPRGTSLSSGGTAGVRDSIANPGSKN